MCDALKELMKPELKEASDQGSNKRAEIIAINLIHAGLMDDQSIADVCGLSAEQVETLRNKESVPA